MDYYYFFDLVGKTEMYIPTLKMFIIQFTCCPCKPKCWIHLFIDNYVLTNVIINASLSFPEDATRTIIEMQILFHCSDNFLDNYFMKAEIDKKISCLVNKAETNQNRILKKLHKQRINVLNLQFFWINSWNLLQEISYTSFFLEHTIDNTFCIFISETLEFRNKFLYNIVWLILRVFQILQICYFFQIKIYQTKFK